MSSVIVLGPSPTKTPENGTILGVAIPPSSNPCCHEKSERCREHKLRRFNIFMGASDNVNNKIQLSISRMLENGRSIQLLIDDHENASYSYYTDSRNQFFRITVNDDELILQCKKPSLTPVNNNYWLKMCVSLKTAELKIGYSAELYTGMSKDNIYKYLIKKIRLCIEGKRVMEYINSEFVSVAIEYVANVFQMQRLMLALNEEPSESGEYFLTITHPIVCETFCRMIMFYVNDYIIDLLLCQRMFSDVNTKKPNCIDSKFIDLINKINKKNLSMTPLLYGAKFNSLFINEPYIYQ